MLSVMCLSVFWGVFSQPLINYYLFNFKTVNHHRPTAALHNLSRNPVPAAQAEDSSADGFRAAEVGFAADWTDYRGVRP